MIKRMLLAGVAFALVPAFALAADDAKKAAKPTTIMSQSDSFQALDKNKDGYLSQDELKGQNIPFSTLDKDGDGKISAQDWADHQKGAAGPAGPTGAPGAPGGTSTPSGASPATPASPNMAPSTSSPSTTPPSNTKK